MQATILVVDDTPTNISLLMEILRGDYRVLAAVNGEQALKIARGDPPPDLILLDVMMPGTLHNNSRPSLAKALSHRRESGSRLTRRINVQSRCRG